MASYINVGEVLHMLNKHGDDGSALQLILIAPGVS